MMFGRIMDYNLFELSYMKKNLCACIPSPIAAPGAIVASTTIMDGNM